MKPNKSQFHNQPDNKDREKVHARKKLAKIARQAVFRGDSKDNAVYAMQVGNEKQSKSLLGISDLEAIYEDELRAFLPTVLNAADLRNREFPEPRWAVPGFIAPGVTIAAGRPKIGKSFFALNIALAVGHGTKALSRISCPQGHVLYASGVTEGSFPEFQERLEIILRDELAPSTVDFVEDMPRLDQGGIGFLRHWIRTHPDARLIVLDTLEHRGENTLPVS